MAHYDIRQAPNDCFDLYEDGAFLCRFSRDTFRESMESLGRSSNWIGSILRLFQKKFPRPYSVRSSNSLERAIEVYGESGFVDYLRGKGFRVVKPVGISDREVIDFLEAKGYVISGLIGDIYYESKIGEKSRLEDKVGHKE
jgi:hypothetical protein